MRRLCLVVLVGGLCLSTLAADPLPVPDEAAQAKAEKVIRDLFKDDFAKRKAADQAELARKLLKVAGETPDDAAARFVLYREARDAAARAGAVDVLLEASDKAAKEFAVNPLEFKAAGLEIAEKATATDARQVVEAAFAVADDAVRADDYASANRLLIIAGKAAPRAKGAGGLVDAVLARQKDVKEIAREFEITEVDRAALKKKPDDPAAAGKVGRFLCLFKGDFEIGLPLLAKGDDARLKALAEKDLEGPLAAASQFEIAEGWWQVADKLMGVERTEARLRARHWYSQAAAGLSGLSKVQAEKRLMETAALADLRPGRTGGGWVVLFRSSDSANWDRNVNKDKDTFAIEVKNAPDKTAFLRLTNTKQGESVIVAVTKEKLLTTSDDGRYGWNGTNKLEYGGRHLGVYDAQGDATKKPGGVCVWVPGAFQGYLGWGFGHTGPQNVPGWTWGLEKVTPTVFEIAVKATPLTPEESRALLVGRKKKP